MHNATTHYQTSFKVDDSDGQAFFRLKRAVHGWVLGKEKDRSLRGDDNTKKFFSRGQWLNLFQTHGTIKAESFYDDAEEAWAIHYTEVDRQVGVKRFWYTDIGLKREKGVVIVSVRVSFAWHAESLETEPEPPRPTVPKVVRYMLDGNKVFSGRPEFQLIEKPIRFAKVGDGKALSAFIRSPDRRYPLIVFNGDSTDHVCEAERLARELTGKCQVAVIASNNDLREEIKHYLTDDYYVREDRLRVYFPFSTRRNSPTRHRYYNAHSPEYTEDRQGIVDGLLRRHSLNESGAVETVEDIGRLITRKTLQGLKESSPEHKKELAEFFKMYEESEKQRDQYKQEADAFAAEVDQREAELLAERAEVSRLKYDCDKHLARIEEITNTDWSQNAAKLMPALPMNLAEVVDAARRFFPRLVFTDRAMESAKDYAECESHHLAWEMLRHLNETMYRIKFVEGGKEIEKAFQDQSGYEVTMKEGPATKNEKKLMDLRKLMFCGHEYDISPHVKHGNKEPKLVRIHFAFDEQGKKIVVGHIGKHIPNATSKSL